jgi:release factor glutamine methyltransferase
MSITAPGSSTLSVHAAWRRASEELQRNGISNHDGEARELTARAFGGRSVNLALFLRDALSDAQSHYLDRLVAERCSGRPLAYILQEWDFAGLHLWVNEDVLIPRPETEGLLALVLAQGREKRGAVDICDVGTGSGCLAVALAKTLPAANVRAVDVSPRALTVARENAIRQGVSDRVRFFQGDLLDGFIEDPGSLDVVVANLPYVLSGEMETLSVEVRREPVLALDGGPDGLSLVRRLIPQAFRILRSGGMLALEIGHGQSAGVLAAMRENGFSDAAAKKDFAGVDRFVIGFKA